MCLDSVQFASVSLISAYSAIMSSDRFFVVARAFCSMLLFLIDTGESEHL